MGSTGAQGFAEAVNDGMVSLRVALEWHLTANHYPPLPRSMIEVAVKAVEMANELDPFDGEGWDQTIDLPEGIEFRTGATTVTVGEAVESLHLDSFLDQ